MRPEQHATLTIDGSVNHLTNQAGAAAVLKPVDSPTQYSISDTFETSKSSDAELRALELGLHLASKHQITHLIIYGDSQSVTDAANGHARFPKHYEHIINLLEKFEDTHAIHLPRKENTSVDLFARLARNDNRPARTTRKPQDRIYRGSNFHRNKRRRQQAITRA